MRSVETAKMRELRKLFTRALAERMAVTVAELELVGVPLLVQSYACEVQKLVYDEDTLPGVVPSAEEEELDTVPGFKLRE